MKKLPLLILIFTQIVLSSLPLVTWAASTNGTPCSVSSQCVSQNCDMSGATESNNYQGVCAGSVNPTPTNTVAGNGTFGGIVPCSAGYGTNADGSPIPNSCGLPQFIQLIKNVITALFVISIPLATIAFVYIGFTLLFSQGNVSKVQEAKGIAIKVVIGFVIILSAWLIVYTITSILLNPSFNFFLKP